MQGSGLKVVLKLPKAIIRPADSNRSAESPAEPQPKLPVKKRRRPEDEHAHQHTPTGPSQGDLGSAGGSQKKPKFSTPGSATVSTGPTGTPRLVFKGAWAQNLNSALKQNQAYKSSNLGGGAAAGSGSQHHPQFDNLAAQSLEKDAKRQRDLEKQRAKQQKERERQAQQFAKQYERNEALQVKARERAAQEAQKALDKQAKHAGRTAGKQGKHLGNGAAPAAAPQSGGRPKSAGRLRAYPSGSEGAVDLPPVHPFRSLPSQPARPATSGYPAASNITVSGSLGSLDDDALGLDESESLSEQTEQTHPTASQAPPDASVPGQQQAHQQKQQQQQQQQAGQGAAATAAAGNSRGLNAPPPKRSDLERVVDRVQKKDFYEIFKHPVTEDVAPGYFKVVERAMDFTTMRAKLESNQYQSWDMLQEDMEVMFNNAMAYNTAETIYHKQAQTLLGVANKLIGLARNGVTDFRGRTAGIVRAHNAQIAAEEKKDRDARRLQERNEKAAVRSAKLAERAAASGIDISQLQLLEAEDGGADGAKLAPGRAMFKEERRSVFIDENARNTYHRIPRDQTFQRWKGLARGANGEGMAFAKGFPWLRATVNLAMPPETYARSLARFAAGLTGRAREIALARAADSISPAASSQPSGIPGQLAGIAGQRMFIPAAGGLQPMQGATNMSGTAYPQPVATSMAAPPGQPMLGAAAQQHLGTAAPGAPATVSSNHIQRVVPPPSASAFPQQPGAAQPVPAAAHAQHAPGQFWAAAQPLSNAPSQQPQAAVQQAQHPQQGPQQWQAQQAVPTAQNAAVLQSAVPLVSTSSQVGMQSMPMQSLPLQTSHPGASASKAPQQPSQLTNPPAHLSVPHQAGHSSHPGSMALLPPPAHAAGPAPPQQYPSAGTAEERGPPAHGLWGAGGTTTELPIMDLDLQLPT